MSKVIKNSVLLFGSFDGIHPGHEYLMEEAQKYGSNTIIVLAQDSVIEMIKKRSPLHNLESRMENLSNEFENVTVVAGDSERGTWSAIKKYQPETIIVGYDQEGLHAALIEIQSIYGFSLVKSDSFEPEKYKSSILRKNKNLI